jgi:hypothetical protein
MCQLYFTRSDAMLTGATIRRLGAAIHSVTVAAMKWIRRLHAWLGVLFAPSILFFVLSGMFQIAGCHEGEAGSEPSSWIVRLAQIHMKQTIEMPRKRAPAPVARTGPPPAEPAAASPAPKPAPAVTMPLKVFFFVMAIGLMCSTVLGGYMAFTPKRDRTLLAVLLAIGTLLPIALMML